MYQKFVLWVETQHGTKIKLLHSDRGGEYTGQNFISFLEGKRTEQHLTTHDTPEHNSITERLNQTILDHVCAMQHDTGLPKSLWAECVHHTVWLKNRLLTKGLDSKSPYLVLYGQSPIMYNLHEWGWVVYVHDDKNDKLSNRTRVGQ